MGRTKGCNSKRQLFKPGPEHPNYKVRYGYTPVYNRGKKQSTVKSKDIVRPCKRYKDSELKELIKPSIANPLCIPGADGKEGNAILLRSIKTPPSPPKARASPSKVYNMDSGNIIVEKALLLSLFNTSYAEHQAHRDCESVDFDMVDLKPWGPYISAVLVCKNCQYKSDLLQYK